MRISGTDLLERLDSITKIMGKELSNVSIMGDGEQMAVAAHNKIVSIELIVGNSYAAEDEQFTATVDDLKGILKERAMLDAEVKDEALHFNGVNVNYSGFISILPFEDVHVMIDSENEELIDQFDTSSAKFRAISDAAESITLNRVPVTDNKNKFLPMYVAVEGTAMICNCADKTHSGVFYRDGVEDGSLRFSMDGMTLQRLLELEKGGSVLTISIGGKRIYVNSDDVNASLALMHETDARAKDRSLKTWRVNRMFLGYGDYESAEGLTKEDIARAQVVIDSNDVRRIVGNIKEIRSDDDDSILINLVFDGEGVNFEYNSKRSAVAEYINRAESYESEIDDDAICEIGINPDVAKDITRLLPEDDILFCLSSWEEKGAVKKRLVMATVERETKKDDEGDSQILWIQAGLA